MQDKYWMSPGETKSSDDKDSNTPFTDDLDKSEDEYDGAREDDLIDDPAGINTTFTGKKTFPYKDGKPGAAERDQDD